MITRKWALSVLSLSLVSSLSAVPAFAAGHGEYLGRGNHYGWNKQQIDFQDIGNGFSWARQAIQQLTNEGVFRGFDNTHFQPAGTLNRAQFASLVSRYFGLQPANGTQEDFRDVHYGDWDFNDIEAAKDYMTMFIDAQGGYDFNPNQPVNRAEAAVTLVQALLKKNAVQLVTPDQANQILSVYSDANMIPQNLRVHVATAVQAGVIKGVASDRFDPLSTLNRAQAATLLYRLQSQLEVLPIDPATGQPIEVVPGTPVTTTGTTSTTGPVITYQSSTYNLPIGSQVAVSSNELGAVYLIPTSYSPANVSSLDSIVNSNLGSKTIVGQVNTTVALNTSNLAAGSYTVYAVDLNGNLSSLGGTVTLNSTETAPSVQLQSRTVDTNGVTYATFAVQTANLANGTPVSVELVNTNGTSLNPVIIAQTQTNNNTASATLAIPANVPYGNYLVKVTAGGYTNQSLTFTK